MLSLEGFNLRRDVYIRMAVLMHKLNKSRDPALNSFKLVLPTWSHLVHWSYSEVPEFLPWSTFFDMPSLQKFAPVMELHEYFTSLKRNKYTKLLLDRVYILQHFEDMFETGNFEEKWKVEKCQKAPKSRYFYYSNITSNNVKCISFHGPATKLSEVFKKTNARTILLEHTEVALHDHFGSKIYWEARRSMRFNFNLREIANQFRETYLNSNDVNDNTFLASDWLNDKPKRYALGGPYLSVHLRRRDFVRGRPDDTPDLKSVAQQISKQLENLRLTKLFIATDAPDSEFIDLKSRISEKYEVYKYTAPHDVQEKFHEAGIAIIEQIICSYARYFIGTAESTFTFRIQEEREILGFPIDTTFNVLCKENNCKKPSVWQIVY
ncbi:O-fucosyltransferase 2 isoform X2 [Rhynchophorus ferrugineus]|uniref:O-fucosyltransferase 2 isoform X2 n=1 Tax=Rhynchophorus ferrugineus TaxID=354439 RepID=UPI003FCD469B